MYVLKYRDFLEKCSAEAREAEKSRYNADFQLYSIKGQTENRRGIRVFVPVAARSFNISESSSKSVDRATATRGGRNAIMIEKLRHYRL